MSSLAIAPLPLPGLCLVTRRSHGDDRGSFARLWSADALATKLVEKNLSRRPIDATP